MTKKTLLPNWLCTYIHPDEQHRETGPSVEPTAVCLSNGNYVLSLSLLVRCSWGTSGRPPPLRKCHRRIFGGVLVSLRVLIHIVCEHEAALVLNTARNHDDDYPHRRGAWNRLFFFFRTHVLPCTLDALPCYRPPAGAALENVCSDMTTPRDLFNVCTQTLCPLLLLMEGGVLSAAGAQLHSDIVSSHVR